MFVVLDTIKSKNEETGTVVLVSISSVSIFAGSHVCGTQCTSIAICGSGSFIKVMTFMDGQWGIS
jgi:hypothetical protein